MRFVCAPDNLACIARSLPDAFMLSAWLGVGSVLAAVALCVLMADRHDG